MIQYVDFLRKVPLFSELDEEQLEIRRGGLADYVKG